MKEDLFRKLILVFAIVIVLVTAGIMFYYSFGVVQGTFTFYMDGAVSKVKAGVNGDVTGVHFGVVYPGGTSRKHITVVNNKPFNQRVDIVLDGEIAPYVTISENYFDLAPDEEKKISLTFRPTEDLPEHNYKGFGKVSFKKF